MLYMRPCTGPGWDGAIFLHSSLHGAIFLICGWNSVDNTPMFYLLLSSACRPSRFSLFPTLPQQWVGLGWARGWERTHQGQLTWTRQRGSSPYDIGSCTAIKARGRRRGWEVLPSNVYTAWRLPDYWSGLGRWWVTAFASLFFFSFLYLFNCLHLNPQGFLLLLFLFRDVRGVSKCLGTHLTAGWAQPTTEIPQIQSFGDLFSFFLATCVFQHICLKEPLIKIILYGVEKYVSWCRKSLSPAIWSNQPIFL